MLAAIATISSCSKAIDCVLEGATTSISATKDASNVKQYTFKPGYLGSHSVSTVDWDFGDGQKTTTTGVASVVHTYATAGTKQVKATIKIKNKNKTCSAMPQKAVEVQ
ncbi:hypothetical protein DBR32_10525 [Taibaiella sp. KBW10]|uniref:PKD domain-containing protein n=1 Tax=Taibaiella sp. KBW10 TaxID=2153357 RepID=UPI000F5A2FE5|nr:PKD domain-containing protein [Taibaiella sp. KBW10]RQO31129.1 hypothetical protein DBR32_10525 [Taibaiella sp. KBW10]